MKPTAIYSAEPAKGWLPWGAFAPFLSIVLVVAPLLVASIALESLGWLDANGDPNGLIGIQAFLLLPFSLVGLVVLGWVRFIERRPLATIGLVGSEKARTFWRGHLIGIATIIAVVVGIWLAGGFEEAGYGEAFGSWRALASIGFLLVGFAVQSSVEEIVFRGWLLSGIARKFNLVLAVMLSSAVFSFLHYDLQQHWLITANTFLFSVFACCWALQAGNIWGVMGWHAGWNWLLATGFELPVTGLDIKLPALLVELNPQGPDYLTGGAQGPEGSFVCSLFFAGASVLLLRRFLRSSLRGTTRGDTIAK